MYTTGYTAAPGLFVLPLRPGGPFLLTRPRLRPSAPARCVTNSCCGPPHPTSRCIRDRAACPAELGMNPPRHQAGAAVLLLPRHHEGRHVETSSVRFSPAWPTDGPAANPDEVDSASGCRGRASPSTSVTVGAGVTVVCAAVLPSWCCSAPTAALAAADASHSPPPHGLSNRSLARLLLRGRRSASCSAPTPDPDRGRARSVITPLTMTGRSSACLHRRRCRCQQVPVWTVSSRPTPHRSEATGASLDRFGRSGQRGRGRVRAVGRCRSRPERRRCSPRLV